ncbi:MAG TPA: DUF5615 family PIN-like protein [Hanamia sp.]|nr:DUF5615 family PIN-like protein [Hanamia sp.]
MRILLDENIPAKLKLDFSDEYEVSSVRDMKWLGKKNGELLGLAAFNGFDIFITLDKNLTNQQNLDKVAIKFIVLLARNNKHQSLQPHVDKIKSILKSKSIPKLNIITAY